MFAVRERCWQITMDKKLISEGKKDFENCTVYNYRTWNNPGDHCLWRGIPQINEEKQISEFLWEKLKYQYKAWQVWMQKEEIMWSKKCKASTILEENMINTKIRSSRRYLTSIQEKSKHEQMRKLIYKKGEKNKWKTY